MATPRYPSPVLRLVPCPGVLPLSAETEDTLRERLVSEALSWVGTPYRQLGATKGVGVDCSMLLVRAMVDAGIVEHYDPRPYPPLWFLHQDDERYLEVMEANATEALTIRRGDFIAFRVGRAFAHSGIILDDGHLVHAFAEDGQVNISPLHHPRLMYADRVGKVLRPRKVFDLFARLREDGLRADGPGGDAA